MLMGSIAVAVYGDGTFAQGAVANEDFKYTSPVLRKFEEGEIFSVYPTYVIVIRQVAFADSRGVYFP